MARKYSKKELQNKSVKELKKISNQLKQIKSKLQKPKPKYSDSQLEFMSVEQLKEVKRKLEKPKPLPKQKKLRPTLIGRTSSRETMTGAVLQREEGDSRKLVDVISGETIQTWNDIGYTEYNSNVLTDGSLLVDGQAGSSCNARYQGLYRYDENSNCIWSLHLNQWLPDNGNPSVDGSLGAHHDAWPLDNGNILIHGSHYISGNNWGRNGNIESGFIIEIQPVGQDGANIVWEWYMADHFIQDRDPSMVGYVNDISDYPHMIDINLPSEINVNGEGSDGDFAHFNTIHYNSDLDAVVISSRSIGHGGGGENFVIQRTGSYGGNIIWRCCNPANYGMGGWDDQLTRHQHGANWIPPDWEYGGDMVIFSNAYFAEPLGICGDQLTQNDCNVCGTGPGGNCMWVGMCVAPIPNINSCQGGGGSVTAAVLKISNIPYVYDCNPNEPCTQATSTWTTYSWDIYPGPEGEGSIQCGVQCGAFGLPNGNLWVALWSGPYEVENPWSGGGSVIWEPDGGDFEPRPIKYVYGCTDLSFGNYDSATPYMLVYDDGNQCGEEDECPEGYDECGVCGGDGIVGDAENGPEGAPCDCSPWPGGWQDCQWAYGCNSLEGYQFTCEGWGGCVFQDCAGDCCCEMGEWPPENANDCVCKQDDECGVCGGDGSSCGGGPGPGSYCAKNPGDPECSKGKWGYKGHPPTMRSGGFTKPKLPDKQLQSMSVEQLEEVKRKLEKPKPLPKQKKPTPLPKQKKLRPDDSINQEFIWVDKDKYPPTRYHDSADYKRSIQQSDSDITLLHTITNNNSRGEGTFVMVMDSFIYSTYWEDIETIIFRWAEDVINDNDFNEVILAVVGEAPPDWSYSQLIDFFLEVNDLKGAFLVGDIDVPWIIDGDDEFPTSKPFEDLGIYVGWLKTSGCGTGEDCLDWSLGDYSNDIDALINYFDKNHEYRTTSANSNNNLIFIDDVEWMVFGFTPEEFNYLMTFSNGIDYYNGLSNTNAEDFEYQMNSLREFSFATGHGNPWQIGFTANDCGDPPECSECSWMNQNDGACYNGFTYSDLLQLSEISQFHIWESCGVGRFTEVNNLGNWYVFHPNSGVVTIAATDSIGVQHWEEFFVKIGECENIGEAKLHANPTFSISAKKKLVIIGDPTLKVRNCGLGLDGCTDPTACNYWEGFESDDGSCIYEGPGYVVMWGVCYDVNRSQGIYLVNAGLEGPIPPEIGQITNLHTLQLGGNELTTIIPASIGQLTSLTLLNLMNNQLQGVIPPEICNQGDPTPRVGNNKLCPPYPSCISQDDINSQDTSECGGGGHGKWDCKPGGDNWPQCLKETQIVRRSGGFTKPKLSREQLQSMSVEQLEEVKIQLQSRPKSMREGGTIKIGDVVRDMNST